MRRNNKALYESIMRKVSRVVKSALNENVSISIDDVIKSLYDGLDIPRGNDYKYVKKRLFDYMNEYNCTIEELETLCWEDSDAIFDYIW